MEMETHKPQLLTRCLQIRSVLELRNQDLLNMNGKQLHSITEANSRETQVMAEIAQCTYNDSRMMRIATVIALVYLPANLVLVSPERARAAVARSG